MLCDSEEADDPGRRHSLQDRLAYKELRQSPA
jgi:hypothetical protein